VLAGSGAKKLAMRWKLVSFFKGGNRSGAMYATMTLEQQRVFEQAVEQGLVKSAKEAYEVGAAALRRQLHERKVQAIAAETADMLARKQLSLF
jgi:hypothetical protein